MQDPKRHNTGMSKVINPIVRALNLLRALNQQPQSSLNRLHEITGLPKSTVHRLLMTLKAEGYVKADVVKGVYSLTEKIRCLSDGYTEHDLVVDVAMPILLKATRRTGLPLAIGTLHGGQITVRYSSMPYSPVGSQHTTVGHVHDLLHSAMGQAYLAYCSDPERVRLMQLLANQYPDQSAAGELDREISQAAVATRTQGFAWRKPSGQGSSATVAIPVHHNTEILAVLGLTTFGALINDGTVSDCAAVLTDVRTEILHELARRPQL